MRQWVFAATFTLAFANAANSEVIQRSLHSAILGEDRPFIVHLPQTYSTRTDQRYPVLYVLDGTSQDGHTAAAAAELARSSLMPEVIVVGIPNTRGNRPRDQTPPMLPLDGEPRVGRTRTSTTTRHSLRACARSHSTSGSASRRRLRTSPAKRLGRSPSCAAPSSDNIIMPGGETDITGGAAESAGAVVRRQALPAGARDPGDQDALRAFIRLPRLAHSTTTTSPTRPCRSEGRR